MVAPAMMPSSVTDAPTIPVAAAKIVATIKTAMKSAPRTRAIIIWIEANRRSIRPAASMMMPIRTKSGTAINWSFSMVELVFSVISKVVSLKFAPHIPKTIARKIRVNEIGNPMKITNSIAASMISPIVGFDRLGRIFMMSVNHSPPGTTSGAKIARTSHVSAIR